MSLERIAQLANLMLEQQNRIRVIEEDLKNAKAGLLRTQREDLPSLMLEVGLTEIKLATGERLVVKENIDCGIPEARKDEAMKWLNEHGFGGLIKTTVSVEFGRGEIEAAEKLAAQLQEQELPAVAAETVHSATLKSFINEQLAAGNSVPFDLFGVFPYSFATFTKK